MSQRTNTTGLRWADGQQAIRPGQGAGQRRLTNRKGRSPGQSAASKGSCVTTASKAWRRKTLSRPGASGHRSAHAPPAPSEAVHRQERGDWPGYPAGGGLLAWAKNDRQQDEQGGVLAHGKPGLEGASRCPDPAHCKRSPAFCCPLHNTQQAAQ